VIRSEVDHHEDQVARTRVTPLALTNVIVPVPSHLNVPGRNTVLDAHDHLATVTWSIAVRIQRRLGNLLNVTSRGHQAIAVTALAGVIVNDPREDHDLSTVTDVSRPQLVSSPLSGVALPDASSAGHLFHVAAVTIVVNVSVT